MRTYLNTRRSFMWLTCLFLLFSGVAQVKADTITIISSITGPGGTGSGSVTTVNPNNDNVTANNPNIISITITFTAVAPIDIVFNVANSAGTTEYFFTSTIVNSSGVAWDHFHVRLGFRGFGTDNGFVLSDLGADEFHFDTPDRNPPVTSSFFTIINHGSDLIDLDTPALPAGSSMTLTFSVDIPANVAGLHPDGLSQFTIRLSPSLSEFPVGDPVVEPATITLLSLGLSGVALKAHSQRKAHKSKDGQNKCLDLDES